jgi:hypothetical protein
VTESATASVPKDARFTSALPNHLPTQHSHASAIAKRDCDKVAFRYPSNRIARVQVSYDQKHDVPGGGGVFAPEIIPLKTSSTAECNYML